MIQSNARRFWLRITVLACTAGIFYSSWPLGYFLNPNVARRGLASALEALNQPYNWLFIALDVSSSLLILLMCWLIWRHYKTDGHRQFLGIVILNIIVFSIGTIIDTLLPEHCLPGAINCPSWRQDHILLVHGVFSILAAFALFLALVFIWWRNRNLLLNSLVVGYLVFGLLSLYEALTPTQGNFSQHYYITLCGVWIALTPYGIHRALLVQEPAESGKKSISSSSGGRKPLG